MAKKKKTPGIAGMGNEPMYRALVAGYTSNAGTAHDSRPKRERTRRDSLRAELRREGYSRSAA